MDTDSNDDSHNQVTENLLAQFKQCLDVEKKQATFACGGSIPIRDPSAVVPARTRHHHHHPRPGAVSSEPITLRWDAASRDVPSHHTTLVFPLEDETEDNLAQLLSDMAAGDFASREREGRDIFQQTSGQILNLDTAAFSTTFDPYRLGIIDTITQVLLPTAATVPDHNDNHRQVVQAELSGLSIHCGPSDPFSSSSSSSSPSSTSDLTITTAAATTAAPFATLIVCLPLEHEGGHLQVRHSGKEMTFDWSTARTDADHAALRWAAFYAGCDHQVRDVATGHRLTLSYNLRAVPARAALSAVIDATHFPLYQFVGAMVREDEFMGNGGYLGFFCAHAYPHTSVRHCPFPDVLKGLDMVIWETFVALGLDVEIRPVMFVRDGESSDDDDFDVTSPPAYLSRDFQIRFPSFRVPEDRSYSQLLHWWSDKHLDYRDITWLSPPAEKGQELQIAYSTDGHKPNTNAAYSNCAIVVRVPPFADRAIDD